jgi:hypothetical protein
MQSIPARRTRGPLSVPRVDQRRSPTVVDIIGAHLPSTVPWWSGTDDGEPQKIAGWDTEPGFTGAMAAAGLGLAVCGARWRSRPTLACVIAALGLTTSRGDLYSGYHVLAAGYERVTSEHPRGSATL